MIIAVVIRSGEPARVAEALRAAVGLTLRGDQVEVVLTAPAAAVGGPAIERACATLRLLGHAVGEGDGVDAVHRADAVEVWT